MDCYLNHNSGNVGQNGGEIMNEQVQNDSWMEGFRGIKVWSALLAWERKERAETRKTRFF